MIRLAASALLFIFIFSSLTSCGENSSNAATEGVLQLRMHDFPIGGKEVQKVVIGIKAIEVHSESQGWIMLSKKPQRLELLQLQDGLSAIILEQPMEPGIYTQIRLLLEENNEIFVDNIPYRLKIPSSSQTGIKLITPFEIKSGKMVEVMLDFDLEKSIRRTKGQGFALNPVIKVEQTTEYDGAGVVSSDGANISTLDGDVNLRVPPGSFDRPVVVSINEVDTSSFPKTSASRMLQVGRAYDLKPEGYEFNTLVQLTFSYDDEQLAHKGLEQNLGIFTFNENKGEWQEIPSFSDPYSNQVYAFLEHFSVYALQVEATCTDGIQNDPETGVDCGGNCPAACTDCNGYNYGSGTSSNWYSFNNPLVIDTAQNALADYAEYRGVDVSTLSTPDRKMEAVAYYVAANMQWMKDKGDWTGSQSAARTIRDSGNRYGCFDSDCTNEDYCYESSIPYSGKQAKYCGDCEDFAILRASLLRHLGVSQRCIMNGDHHAGLDHPDSASEEYPWEQIAEEYEVDPDGPSGEPQAYDYETASNLFEPDAKKKGGHTFNVVLYNNKYRLMDYFWLGYYFSSNNAWESHQVDNVWNDHFGQHWYFPLTPPPEVIHNYPGENKCYEEGKSYWTHSTLYKDICP